MNTPADAFVSQSVAYLSSQTARDALARDPYWPKWDSPWWHMRVLYEMGEAAQIPASIVEAHVRAIDAIPLKIFPIQPEEMPFGLDPYRQTSSHCQIGTVYQVFSACGIDVDHRLPWMRRWLLSYQMADGGMSCDNSAYLAKGECPSSMVGTISAFEAILLHTPRAFTAEETRFLNRAAAFFIHRRLIKGSETLHNSSERKTAEEWPELCFPRIYFYDILRGLTALLAWSKQTKKVLPREAIEPAVKILAVKFPTSEARTERRSFQEIMTLDQDFSGRWQRRQAASYFPLLNAVSKPGEVSPWLSREWSEARRQILATPGLRSLLD